MRIVSVRLSDDEYKSLVRRAGKKRGALSKLLRRLLAEPPAPVITISAQTTNAVGLGRAVIQSIHGYEAGGGTINLRSL